MAYVTLAQLAEFPGSLEMAQVASDQNRRAVATELMDATLRGGDRSAFAPEDVARADGAAARIREAITQADSIIDGFLARRYTLPLSKAYPLLAVWSRAITRYNLHGTRLSNENTDPVVRDYRDAIRLLQLTAESKFHLGVDDPTTSSSALGEFIIHPGNKVFGREGRP